MRSSRAEWLERLTTNAVVATVLGSILASSDTVESEGRQMKQCCKKKEKNPPLFSSVIQYNTDDDAILLEQQVERCNIRKRAV